jgi:acetyl-CoA C-acetyltransferase
MRDAVICEPRTPVGRYRGVFKDIPAAELAETVIRELVRRGLAPEHVDDVIFGQCYPNGEAPAIGRVASLDAGLGIRVPDLQIDRRCGSGLQAVIDAAMRVQTGAAELAIAGGAESLSQAAHYVLGARWGGLRGDSSPLWDRIARGRITWGGKHHPVEGGMLETAENLRREYGITRQKQDELALRSHARSRPSRKAVSTTRSCRCRCWAAAP